MADRLDIRKVIEQGSQHTTLSNLASAGVKNVKVLDEAAIHEMIRRAVDEVISTQTEEERAAIVAESREKLDSLLRERQEMLSQASMLEANKAELVRVCEKLQNEIRVLRPVQDQLKAALDENTWLREGNDKMVEQVDQLQTENKRLQAEVAELRAEIERLKAEIERLQGAQSDPEELESLRADRERLERELEEARAAQADPAELESLRAELEAERAKVRKAESDRAALESLKENHAQLEQELDEALQEAGRLREEFDGAKAGEAESAGAREESAQLQERLAAEAEQARRTEAELRARQAELEAQLAEAQERQRNLIDEGVNWLRQEIHNAIQAQTPEPVTAPAVEEPPPPPPPPEPAPLPDVVEVEELPAEPAPEPPPPAPRAAGEVKPGKGLDIGTVNLVAAEQNAAGEIELRLKRNAFIDIEVTAYTKSMLTRLNVPYFIQGKKMYVLGEHAFELANILNRHTRRPMKDGLISPKEQDALPTMKLLISSILGEPRVEREVCFYSVPGEPVDSDLSVAYHRDLFDAVLKSLGYKPSHIIEGHAVTFSELADEDFTGIGISCGGGMFNVCVAYKSMPALVFSTARSGDWVDLNVANALGIKPVKAALLKEKGVDILKPKNREEDAISIYYKNLIKYNLTSIAERFRSAENMPTFSEPVSVVFSGGTSMAVNFIEVARAVFKELDFPIPVKELRMAKDPLNATAKGALAAALLEMTQQA